MSREELVGNGRRLPATGSIRERHRRIAGDRLAEFPIDDKLGEDIETTDLITAHNKRREQRLQVYERVYRKCCHRIRYANDVQYTKECFFQVPEVQLWGGVPRYQLNAVIAYIMLKLKQKGFDVRYVAPDGVMVNWGRMVAGDQAGLVYQSLERKQESRVIRYELDEETTSAKPLDHLTTPGERLLHDGCKGECCVGGGQKPQRVTRQRREEIERMRQQDEISRLIAERDGAE